MATRISKQKLATVCKIMGMFMSDRIATYQTSTKVLGYTQNGKQSHDCAQNVAVALRSGNIVYVTDGNRVIAWLQPTAEHTVKVHREAAKALKSAKQTKAAKATVKQSKPKPKSRYTTYRGRKYYSAPVGRTPKQVEEARAQCWLNSSAKTYKERVRLQQKMREFSDEADLAWLLNGAN